MEEKDINIESLQLDQEKVTFDIEHCKSSGIDETLEEKRGIKRKRDDDDDQMNNKSSHETQGNGSFWL